MTVVNPLNSIAMNASVSAHTASAATITMDQIYLDHAKNLVLNGDPALQPSYDKLLEVANALLPLPPESVTYKKIMPPSGSKSDYMSLAPYWWPDPSKPDGLPYIQRDGEFNPSSKNGDTDSVRMQFMCMSAHTLSLAWFFSGEQKFADKAADVIRTWFLAIDTRMNPNLNFGQAVMGRNDGRGIGLIDSRNFWMVIDAAQLISATGALSGAEIIELKKWFKDFAHWMLSSPVGIEEFIQPNNHGTCYDMQIACYALFAGEQALAKITLERAKELRIKGQIALSGKMHMELERTTPFHYTAFNLEFMQNLARYGEQAGVDLWKPNEKVRCLIKGIRYLAQYALHPEKWPHPELREMESELALPVLLRAERAYRNGEFGPIALQLPERKFEAQEFIALYRAIGHAHPTVRNSIEWLIWPIMDAA